MGLSLVSTGDDKSLRNYPDVTEVFDRDGSDAMRWFLMASPILRGGKALIVTEQGIRDGVHEVLLPLEHLQLPGAVCTEVGTWRVDSLHVLDRYILASWRRCATTSAVDGSLIFPVPVSIASVH